MSAWTLQSGCFRFMPLDAMEVWSCAGNCLAAREGVALSLSTLADQVGACATALQPIHDLIRAHVLAAERLHGDDTTVPLLARGATKQARLWTYVRDDRPFAGGAPPAALFHFSPDREKTHPNTHLAGWHGILQADAYGATTTSIVRIKRCTAPGTFLPSVSTSFVRFSMIRASSRV